MNTNRNIKQKKCRYCETLFYPIRSTAIVCSWECANLLAKEKSEKKKAKEWNVRKKELKEDLMSLQDWIKIAQTHFNTYIRLRDKGNVCISCQKPINGVKHASHYLSAGGHSNVRFHEDNVFVSCYKCNVMLSGNQIEYRKALIEKIGVERVEWLEDNGSIVKKWTIDELKELIKLYKNKLKNI